MGGILRLTEEAVHVVRGSEKITLVSHDYPNLSCFLASSPADAAVVRKS